MKNLNRWVIGMALALVGLGVLSGCHGWRRHHHHHPHPPCAPEAPAEAAE